jgi:hypothetical protein
MRFLRNLLINLVILVVMLAALYFLLPSIMGPVFRMFGALLGPGFALLWLISAALPPER